MIRSVVLEDAESICSIYNHYIAHSTCTFEIELVTVDEIRERIRKALVSYPYLVFVDGLEVVAYAYLMQFRTRSAYAHVAESSVYVHSECLGQGIGKQLYQALLNEAKSYGLTEIMAVMALPNPASEGLHSSLGFREMGVLKNMGWKFEKMIDTGYWQYSSNP